MSDGIWLLLPILAGFASAVAFQAVLARRSRRREGTAVGALPAPHDAWAREDALWWFHSPTCGPCRAMRGEVADLEASGRLHVVDVSTHPEVARALTVMATPTTVHIRDGRIVAVRVGVLRRDQLEALLAG